MQSVAVYYFIVSGLILTAIAIYEVAIEGMEELSFITPFGIVYLAIGLHGRRILSYFRKRKIRSAYLTEVLFAISVPIMYAPLSLLGIIPPAIPIIFSIGSFILGAMSYRTSRKLGDELSDQDFKILTDDTWLSQ